jgi:hypothetical protein
MRSYRIFVMVFFSLLVLYIIAELNRPKPIDWSVTLSKEDKNPYGAFILFDRLKDVFPASNIVSEREPVYNLFHEKEITNSALILIAPVFGGAEPDVKELLKFAEKGNYVFLSSFKASTLLMDTLGLRRQEFSAFLTNDSTSLNFVNPYLKAARNYQYKKLTVDAWFSDLNKRDSTTILGITHIGKPDFLKIKVGNGAFFVHAAPLCFSNYYMEFNNDHEYVAKALSYIPKDVNTVYWDEYYKLGRTGATTPLRFFLNNEWLRWALRITIVGFILFALVEMKRRQRIIPVIAPLRNTTLDFVQTVAGVYLGQKDNKNIAENKFQYWLHYIRQRYYLQTNDLSEDFVQLLAKKSGVDEEAIQQILQLFNQIVASERISDKTLLQLNYRIEQFYTSSKT